MKPFFGHLWAARQVMCCLTVGFVTGGLSPIDPAHTEQSETEFCSKVNKKAQRNETLPLQEVSHQVFQTQHDRGVAGWRSTILGQKVFPSMQKNICPTDEAGEVDLAALGWCSG